MPLIKKEPLNKMPKFNFNVRDRFGKNITGTVTMDSRDQLIERLRDQGYFVNKITEIGENTLYERLDRAIQRLSPIKLKDMSIFSRLMSTMINAGLPILRSLRIIVKQTENTHLAEILQNVAKMVEEGYSLSHAMGQHPKVFDVLMVNLIKSGEESGSLDIVLDRIAMDMEREIEIRQNVQAGIRYPIIILSAAALIVGLIMIFVVPKFVEIFRDMDATLPTMTLILIKISNVVVHGAPFLIAIIFLLIIGSKYASNFPFFNRIKDNIQLRLPVFGFLLRRIALSRFSRTFAILLKSGVPIIKSLTVVEETVGNAVIAAAVAKAKISIKEGERISYPLEETGEFPPMVIDMISVGEETGSLDDMLQKISDFYDREVDYTIDAFTTMIEPVLITLMGVVIGFIVISLYLPLFSAIENMTNVSTGTG
jgi:type IV pilus assembly protein PilC